ncbi:elongation factor P maturation arginine rhamnosyltransferase EarP [Tepidicella baoligensis]|uniref:elongation factor P maturation arginine rhamnosyltransferase EarP n=1 Tax=Tepidicella baoligensis TaxID=2707016 RepID=UPI0015DB52EE|nr:elongation factor P maturation arginine rhamnosyltransferase EarP [Tepidicella baoligensis]
MPHVAPPLHWDIFCRVIDNHGDVGVCWRLARGLASQGQRVRLWLDQTDALHWMAPGALEGDWPQIEAWAWETEWPHERLANLPRSDVWVEAFGCEPPEGFVLQQRALWPSGEAPVWVNLEYLSAEPYVERMHRLPSPLMSGPARGWTRWFFYPGFTSATGGLLREVDLLARQAAFARHAWRDQATPGGAPTWISLFCYEPLALPWLLGRLHDDSETTLLITPGRAEAAVQRWLGSHAPPRHWVRRPLVDQPGFDEMLWACDLNFVRGEDSLVRALWAGQAFVWQIYPQDDNAHHTKLHAFLDWLGGPADLRDFHLFWNGMGGHPPPDLSPGRLRDWANVTEHARARLLQQHDLVTQLLGFVMEKR